MRWGAGPPQHHQWGVRVARIVEPLTLNGGSGDVGAGPDASVVSHLAAEDEIFARVLRAVCALGFRLWVLAQGEVRWPRCPRQLGSSTRIVAKVT